MEQMCVTVTPQDYITDCGVFAVALVSPLCDGHDEEVPWALVYQNKPYDSLIRDYKLVSPHMLPSLKRHIYDFLGRH